MAILEPSSVSLQTNSTCTGPLSASFWNPGTPITRILCIRKRTSAPEEGQQIDSGSQSLPARAKYDALDMPLSAPAESILCSKTPMAAPQ